MQPYGIPANDWRTDKNMAITPGGPVYRTILCCDVFIRRPTFEGFFGTLVLRKTSNFSIAEPFIEAFRQC